MWLLLLGLTVAAGSQETAEKRPFSPEALEWLIGRGEYDRFDYFVSCYQRLHPDTAVLWELRGRRYFDEAMREPAGPAVSSARPRGGPTGGIPRKYPDYLRHPQLRFAPGVSRGDSSVHPLMHKAFSALRTARRFGADSVAVAAEICRMALAAHHIDYFIDEALAMARGDTVPDTLFHLTRRFLRRARTPGERIRLRELVADLHRSHPDDLRVERLLDGADSIATNDTADLEALRTAVNVAMIEGDFARAAHLARARHRHSHELLDLEIAAICALAHDSVQAAALREKIVSSPDYADSLSVSRFLFDEHSGGSIPGDSGSTLRVFSGELFCLNFPLFRIRYRRHRDRVALYLHKAAAFYVCGRYDSAAFYNLNLLRKLSPDSDLGPRALFNLAGEYYAQGKYDLSYVRFMNLYRHFDGWKDPGVRYALGLVHEQLGDRVMARHHLSYAAENPEPYYERYYALSRRAAKRLRGLGRDRRESALLQVE